MKAAECQDQLDIFSAISHTPTDNYCCVIKDGIAQDMMWHELFDAHKFDTLACVTYVSSARFFEKAVNGFSKVSIVIGIEKGDVKRAINDSLRARIYGDGAKFFGELPDKSKSKLLNGDFTLRYSKPDCIIHSKFYLLSNTCTAATRIIFGSANLTNTAFDNSVHQYEDVMVFDDDDVLFHTYTERFQAIFKDTEDYVPSEIKERYLTGKMVSIADFTPEEKANDLLETLRRHNIVPVCTEAFMQQAEEGLAADVKETEEVRATFEVINTVSKRSKADGSVILRTTQELAAAKTKIIDILFRATKKEAELSRFMLTFNDADKKQYVLFSKSEHEQTSREPEMFDRQASPDEIRQNLENIERFIFAYQQFVHTPDDSGENLARIFEVILYAFCSAYIFYIRQAANSKADIPVMLIIGGRASSGKSYLLAYIDRILSGRKLSTDRHYIQYKNVEGKNSILALFQTDNTYPLLIDEVSPGFFKSQSTTKGEELIKFLSNTLSGRHPVMICTTNTGAFNIPAQVERRIYYLQVDSCFDEEKKAQANEYYETVMQEATNTLFRDFCYRMGESIRHGELVLSNGEADYLYSARKIFREYYKTIGRDVPKYFPTEIYQDYVARGRNIWRTLFLQEQELFNYDVVGKNSEPTLTVKLKEIANHDNTVYLNYLRQDLLVEEAGVFTVLRAQAFFNWIDVKNPWKKQLFWKKIMHRNKT